LWLLRDQMSGADGGAVNMFWQAASTTGNAIPALATFDPLDPRYYQTHVVQLYPRVGATTLPQQPDRVTLRLRLQAVGLDVLEDLVDSGDLDAAAVASAASTYDVSFLGADGGIDPYLEWTPAAASTVYMDEFDDTPARCVSTYQFNVGAAKVRAPVMTAPSGCSP
jgi:hypothetical protein